MVASKVVRTNRRKSRISVIALLAMLSISCNFGGLLPGPSGSGEITGPIIGMVPGTSVGENGGAVDPTFTFDPSAPQIAVVVQVGKLDSPAPMTITWYQVTDQGNQQLFTDTIQVSALDWAYSIGENPGKLAEGSYTVTATLGGQTQEMGFDVSAQGASAPGSAPVSTRQGTPPVSGGSGATPQSGAAPPAASTGSSPSGCEIGPSGADYVDPNANTVDVFYRGQCSNLSSDKSDTVFVSAAIKGSSQELGIYDVSYGQTSMGYFSNLNPCLPDGSGSDLPGTKVLVTSIVREGANLDDKVLDTVKGTYTLGEDKLAPRIEPPLKTDPLPGKRVRQGDKIKITANAQERRKNGTWQDGVKEIEINANGYLIESWANPSLPKACDNKTWEHSLDTTYTVKKGDPPIIKICAFARDWNQAGQDVCAEFHNGVTWKGTMHTVAQEISHSSAGDVSRSGTYDSTLEIVEDSNGNVMGHGTATLTSGCPPWPEQVDPAAKTITFDVSGMAYKDRFELQLKFTGVQVGVVNCGFVEGFFRGQPLVIPIIGTTTAQGPANDAFHLSGTDFSSQGTVDLKCEDCK